MTYIFRIDSSAAFSLLSVTKPGFWEFTMSQARVFSLIGDSNVKRHMNPTNCRDRPAMIEAQVIPCTKISVLQQSLRSVRDSSNVCILSCISNFLSDSDSSASSMALRLEPVYTEFFRKLLQSCQSMPNRTFFVCPPMFRTTPGLSSSSVVSKIAIVWSFSPNFFTRSYHSYRLTIGLSFLLQVSFQQVSLCEFNVFSSL